MELKIEYISVEDLNPYARNNKKHADFDVGEIAKSIKKYGFNDPIGVYGENVIVEGHGRLLAAKKLGMETVPCIRLDHMTDKERREYAILHNKTAELAEYDFENLAVELPDLDFSDFEIDFGLDETKSDETPVQEVDVPELDESEEPKAQFGQIYRLGDHLLMCGDSTSEEMVDKLTRGGQADCVCTDPPYNMGYEGAGRTPKAKRQKNRIVNDNLPKEDFEKFLLAIYKNMHRALADGASFYVFYKELGEGVFCRLLGEAGLTYKQELVWVKNHFVLGGAKYQNMYEPCLFGCKGQSVKKWYGGRKNRSVIEHIDLMDEEELRTAMKELLDDLTPDVVREKKILVSDLHPTMKPIKLLAKLIRNSTEQGDVVLDLFGGSGSTLMACEQIGRKCRMIEYEPRYVDVIIKRWEDFTGRKAELISD